MFEETIIRNLLNGSLKTGVCRVCLSESSELLSLNGVADDIYTMTYKEMLISVSTVEIEDNEWMPENICKECSGKIINSYCFRIQCEDVNSQLLNCISCFHTENANMNNAYLIVLSDNDTVKEEVEDYSEIKLENGDGLPQFKDVLFMNNSNKQFDCSICFQVFESAPDLKVHSKLHPDATKHVCKICFKRYRKLSILKRHMVTHSGKKMYTCYVCGNEFYHRNALMAHERYHRVKQFKCKLCDVDFYFKYLAIEHLKSNHYEEYLKSGNDAIVFVIKEEATNEGFNCNKYDCTMCNETFDNESELILHKLTHPDGTKHVCRICSRSYNQLANLKRHSVTHTNKKTYLCNTCGKSFYHGNVLKAHMMYHREKRFHCKLCEKKYHTAHMLKEHVRLTHTTDKYNFMCETCGKLCSSKSRLMLHMQSHTKTVCGFCGKGYRNARYYKEHLKSHTNGVVMKSKIFICDYCGESRNLKTLLERHILSKHLNDRRFKCNYCTKAFFSNGSLREHGAVHSKERPEQCDLCGKRLINKKALVIHKRLHSGERPYVCNVCGESFVSISRRFVHLKSKHGEQTEMCSICPAKFHQRGDLNRHYSLHGKDGSNTKFNEILPD